MAGIGDHCPSVEPLHKVVRELRNVCNGDGGVVLDVKRGQIYRLNSVGAMIFEGIKCGQPARQIADALTSQFGVKRDIAEADVRAFMARLQSNGLIEVESGCPSEEVRDESRRA
jgi:coenzyme PQQ synthesis protein D (PqqD)